MCHVDLQQLRWDAKMWNKSSVTFNFIFLKRAETISSIIEMTAVGDITSKKFLSESENKNLC